MSRRNAKESVVVEAHLQALSSCQLPQHVHLKLLRVINLKHFEESKLEDRHTERARIIQLANRDALRSRRYGITRLQQRI